MAFMASSKHPREARNADRGSSVTEDNMAPNTQELCQIWCRRVVGEAARRAAELLNAGPDSAGPTQARIKDTLVSLVAWQLGIKDTHNRLALSSAYKWKYHLNCHQLPNCTQD
jgi:hypothetical protein